MKLPLRVTGGVALLVAAFLIWSYLARPAWYLRVFRPLKYAGTITAHAENYDLPPDLVAAVIMQESGFDARARSGAGAVGLMQLTPDTAKGIAQYTGGARFVEEDLLDPEINIRYGCWYLRNLHEKFDDRGRGYDLTLAAYNAGQGRVRDWIDHDDDGTLTVSEIPYAETRSYVRHVNELRRDYRKAYPNQLT